MAKTVLSKKELRRKWLVMGGSGALFLGSGVAGAVESGFLKHTEAPAWQWIVGGTFSLVLLITGVIIMIKSAFLEQQLKE